MPDVTSPRELYFKNGIWAWTGALWLPALGDAAGHLQIDVITSGLPAGSATAAHQVTQITSLQLIDDLRNALNDVGTDELRTIPYPHGIWGVTGVTQILRNATVTNGNIIIYTVPAGKTFYLTSFQNSMMNNSAVVVDGDIRIRNNLAVAQLRFRFQMLANLQHYVVHPFIPPLHLATGWDIIVRSLNVNYTVNTAITGYTI